MVVIAIYIVLALTGLGLLTMLIFGIRSLTFGGRRRNILTLVIVCVPVVLLLVLGLVIGNWAQAGILAVFAMLALAVLSLLVTGVKGLFS